jgi:hypothetical protein
MKNGPPDLADDDRWPRLDISVPETVDPDETSAVDWTTDLRVFLHEENREPSSGKLTRCHTPSGSGSNDYDVSVHS